MFVSFDKFLVFIYTNDFPYTHYGGMVGGMVVVLVVGLTTPR